MQKSVDCTPPSPASITLNKGREIKCTNQGCSFQFIVGCCDRVDEK